MLLLGLTVQRPLGLSESGLGLLGRTTWRAGSAQGA